jgi:hypothetical protein
MLMTHWSRPYHAHFQPGPDARRQCPIAKRPKSKKPLLASKSSSSSPSSEHDMWENLSPLHVDSQFVYAVFGTDISADTW